MLMQEICHVKNAKEMLNISAHKVFLYKWNEWTMKTGKRTISKNCRFDIHHNWRMLLQNVVPFAAKVIRKRIHSC